MYNSINIAYCNVHGLQSSEHALQNYIIQNSIDIFFIAETWVSSDYQARTYKTIINIPAFANSYQSGLMLIASPDIANQIQILKVDNDLQYMIIQIFDTILCSAYFPPSMDDKCIEMIQKELSSYDFEAILFFGDINTRLKLYGDHTNTKPVRAKYIKEWIDDIEWFRCQPEEGKWTSKLSHNPNSRGIPDHLFCNKKAISHVCNYRVDENNNLLSDHNPLLFTILNDGEFTKSFQRWNINALQNPQKVDKFQKNLIARFIPKSIIWKIKFKELEQQWNILKYEKHFLKEMSNQLYSIYDEIFVEIKSAMRESCGIFKFKEFDKSLLNDSHLNALLDKIKNIASRLKTAKGQAYQEHHKKLTNVKRQYKKLCKQKQQLLKTKELDSTNQVHITKVIASKLNKKKSSFSCLQPSKLDSYAEHFVSTFGGDPTGTIDFDTSIDECFTFEHPFNSKNVFDIILNLPNGKACGLDGIFNEMLKASALTISDILADLFNLFYNFQIVPTLWKQASITLVFKKKGDINLVKNYRPIALTSCVRRVYEIRLAHLLEKHDSKLNLFQNGFRRKRNSFDNLFYLQELFNKHPNLHHVFLDLQTAYDSVDRRILWKRLNSIIRVPNHLLFSLQSLFDDNECFLMVGGKLSKGISNKRGLLQGSSLSPILFNYFIAGLQELLDASPDKVNLFGIESNHLLFADDNTLHAKTPAALRCLLNICHKWAKKNGMIFHAQKSFIISNLKNESYEIMDQVIPHANDTKYLGFWINLNGIDFVKTFEERTKETIKLISFYRKFGNFYLNGFRPNYNLNIFKIFIRSRFEYGLALGLLSPKVISSLQIIQNVALRTMLSTGESTSINAMHRLLNLSKVEFRNQELNFNWICRIKNNSNTLAGLLYMKMNQSSMNDIPNTSSLFRSFYQSTYWDILHELSQSSLSVYDFKKMFSSVSYSKSLQVNARQFYMNKLETNSNSVASMIPLNCSGGPDSIISANFLSRDTQKLFIYWKLGRLITSNYGVKCKNNSCLEKLSRKHVCECVNAQMQLQNQFKNLDVNSDVSLVDQALKDFQFTEKNLLKITILDAVIYEVKLFCL
jgi:hypothetical protein